MKIALVSPYDYAVPGGVTKHVSSLASTFQKWGHEVRIIAPSSDGRTMPGHVIKASGFVAPVPFSGSTARISLSLPMYRRVKHILEREQFDIIHLHEPMTPALPLFVLRHSEAVNVGTFHAYRESPHVGYDYGRPILAHFINRLDGRIAVSEATRDYTAGYFPGEYRVIPNGVDVERFSHPALRPLERFDDGRPNVLFLGRLERRKGFTHLLRAFARVKAELPQARLIVVGAYGRKEEEFFARYAGRQGMAGVEFVGYVAEDELPRYYRSAHVFCAPSTGCEGFGLVLLEAMAAGRPIVASDIAGYRSVVRHGREGLLVPPGDVAAIAEALLALLRSPERRAEMGRQGRARAAAYSWDRVARQVMGYYEELLARIDLRRSFIGHSRTHEGGSNR